MRFQYFDSLYITTPRVPAAMTARRHKVCLVKDVQSMNRFRLFEHSIIFTLHDDMRSDKYRS